ncbi:MAG: hypothetical protein OEV73_00520 [Desulfobulbaceae bacterium]|nr:hypothetical protein [Desulfobulbaceae bacterium]
MDKIQMVIAAIGLLLAIITAGGGYLGGRFHAARKAGAAQALSEAAVARLGELVARVDTTVFDADRLPRFVTRTDCDQSKRDYRTRVCAKLDDIKGDLATKHLEITGALSSHHQENGEAFKRLFDWQLGIEKRVGGLEAKNEGG